MTTPNNPPSLTDDQLIIVECLANGMTWSQITTYMRKSPHKIKDLGSDLYVKLGASNAAQAVSAAYEAALLPRSVDDLKALFGAIRERLTEAVTTQSRKDTRSR